MKYFLNVRRTDRDETDRDERDERRIGRAAGAPGSEGGELIRIKVQKERKGRGTGGGESNLFQETRVVRPLY